MSDHSMVFQIQPYKRIGIVDFNMATMVPVIMAYNNNVNKFHGDRQTSNESSLSEEESNRRKKEKELIEKMNKERMKLYSEKGAPFTNIIVSELIKTIRSYDKSLSIKQKDGTATQNGVSIIMLQDKTPNYNITVKAFMGDEQNVKININPVIPWTKPACNDSKIFTVNTNKTTKENVLSEDKIADIIAIAKHFLFYRTMGMKFKMKRAVSVQGFIDFTGTCGLFDFIDFFNLYPKFRFIVDLQAADTFAVLKYAQIRSNVPDESEAFPALLINQMKFENVQELQAFLDSYTGRQPPILRSQLLIIEARLHALTMQKGFDVSSIYE